ncbi:hypothetical protein GYMLUDRAFT_42106 [Collybiopsis luxurians FD-317 M1]|uniref:Uncharacterized protein n=1 Tax=Collybiopsis luxurians FD-317 M1 TaxID=944289 RepID=A0A0D0CS63_9AGAR|nr:hypothetical protein GYMLUDRAFT_42106 [Collybiopsis luxurians FD-317 M1]
MNPFFVVNVEGSGELEPTGNKRNEKLASRVALARTFSRFLNGSDCLRDNVPVSYAAQGAIFRYSEPLYDEAHRSSFYRQQRHVHFRLPHTTAAPTQSCPYILTLFLAPVTQTVFTPCADRTIAYVRQCPNREPLIYASTKHHQETCPLNEDERST